MNEIVPEANEANGLTATNEIHRNPNGGAFAFNAIASSNAKTSRFESMTNSFKSICFTTLPENDRDAPYFPGAMEIDSAPDSNKSPFKSHNDMVASVLEGLTTQNGNAFGWFFTEKETASPAQPPMLQAKTDS